MNCGLNIRIPISSFNFFGYREPFFEYNTFRYYKEV
jgi:hypothetical protein